MSYVSTRTMIPIASIAKNLGLDYWHFFGQYIPDVAPTSPSCDDDTYQFAWQSSGKLAREDFAFALRQAEDMAISFLRWTPIPQWFEEEHQLPDYYKGEMYSYRNSRFESKSIRTNYGYVTEVGRRLNTYLGTPAIVWIDNDGDGFTETGQITIATTATESTELHLYYPTMDGADEYEIRPLGSISIAGGVATIEFPRYLAALPELLEAFIGDDPHILIDATDDANYLTTVDVYWVRTDTTEQGVFVYEGLNDCISTPCLDVTESICVSIREARLGILSYQRADYANGAFASGDYSGLPHKLRVYYRAGWKDANRRYNNTSIDPNLERMIIFYSLTLLDTEPHGCTNTRNIWQKQVEDFALATGEKRYTISFTDIDNNPLGMTRAGVHLWKYIQPRRIQGFRMP